MGLSRFAGLLQSIFSALAENVQHEAMHPAHQFVAFAALVEQGIPVEDVAAEICGAGRHAPGFQRVFLADGDALAAPFETIESALIEIREHLPAVTRVGIYADARAILEAYEEQLED